MSLLKQYIYIIFIIFNISFGVSAQDLSNHNTYTGGIYNINQGAIVEGSAHIGGIQPNYLIDLNSKGPMEDFLSYSRGLRDLPPVKRVEKVIEYIQRALPDRRYDSPTYLNSLETYKNLGKPIPLSEYLKNGAGVCRENSLLTHIGLREAGIESRYTYIKAQVVRFGEKHIEDHALVLIEKKGRIFTVDSYNSTFHNVKFSDLLQEDGFKINNGSVISVKTLNEYPKVYTQKVKLDAFHHPGDQCLSIFSLSTSLEHKIMKNMLNSHLQSKATRGLWSRISGALFP